MLTFLKGVVGGAKLTEGTLVRVPTFLLLFLYRWDQMEGSEEG